MQTNSSKFTQILLGVITISLIIIVVLLVKKNISSTEVLNDIKTDTTNKFENVASANTYIYKNHGFEIELPKSLVPQEDTNARGNSTTIMFSTEAMIDYRNDAVNWEANAKNNFKYQGQEKIGENTFRVYLNPSMNAILYWLKNGSEGYMFSGDKELLKTFKLIDSRNNTYLYQKYGFQIELPKGFIPQEIEGETGPTTSIELPEGWLISISDANWWEKYNIASLEYVKDQKIGSTTFKVYKSRYSSQSYEAPFYSFWFKQGNVAYLFNGKNGQTGDYGASQLETFKFIGIK